MGPAAGRCRNSRTAARRPGAPRARGFTLIEVLVTLVVLSIGLLGVAGMQMTGLRNNYSAYARSQATILANDMLDRIAANRNMAASYAVSFSAVSEPAPNCASVAANCTPAQLAAFDVWEWKTAVAATLPLGAGSILINPANNLVTVTVLWDDRRTGGAPNCDDMQCLSLSTRI